MTTLVSEESGEKSKAKTLRESSNTAPFTETSTSEAGKSLRNRADIHNNNNNNDENNKDNINNNNKLK